MSKRKQHPGQSPGQRPAKQRAKGPAKQRAKGPAKQRAKGPAKQRAKGPAKQRARSAKTKRKLHTIEDLVLGKVAVPIDDEAWTSNEDMLDPSQSRFAWVYWEDEDPCIVYKIEQRGGKFLVLCCPPVKNGFVNEISLNSSEVTNFQFVDPEAIDAEVKVESWEDLHQCSKHVGDHYFWGSRKCHTCSEQLGSNKAYLFCHGCSHNFHTSCISHMALSYRGNGSVRIVDDDDSLQCPACSALLVDPRPHPQGTDASSVVSLEFDMGTSRSRCKGTYMNAIHYLLDDSDSPKPLVTFDPVNKVMYFERRVGDGLVVIEPLKMIICDNVQLPDGFSTEGVLALYFQNIIRVMLRKFEGTLLDTATVQITLAVALPSGSTLKQKTMVLNAIHEAHQNTKPIVTEEATMSLYYAIGNPTTKSKSTVISVDMGGYTDDASIHAVNTTRRFIHVNTMSSTSTHSGDEWVVKNVVQKLEKETGLASDKPESYVRQHFKDLYVGLLPSTKYQIDGTTGDFAAILQKYITEQTNRATILFKPQVGRYPGRADAMYLTGGGVKRIERREQFKRIAAPALKPNVVPKVSSLPASETSAVLEGLGIYTGRQQYRENQVTVVIESRPTDDEKQFIVLQQAGEATEAPVVPAGRSTGVIIFEIQPGVDLHSSHRLLATTEDVTTTVNELHYQIAKIDDDMESKMFELGKVEFELSCPQEVDRSNGFVEVVQIVIHEGYSWTTTEALLLLPNEGDCADWSSWGINEYMSTGDIERMAKDSACGFTVVSKAEKKYLALDMHNKEDETQFFL